MSSIQRIVVVMSINYAGPRLFSHQLSDRAGAPVIVEYANRDGLSGTTK